MIVKIVMDVTIVIIVKIIVNVKNVILVISVINVLIVKIVKTVCFHKTQLTNNMLSTIKSIKLKKNITKQLKS